MEFNWLFFLPVHWDSKNSATEGSLKREIGAGMKSPPQSAPFPLPMGRPWQTVCHLAASSLGQTFRQTRGHSNLQMTLE